MPPWHVETKNSAEVAKAASRRESLRLRLTPARSIEETGLDPSLYGEFLSPHATLSPGKDLWNKVTLVKPKAEYSMGNCSKPPAVPVLCCNCNQFPLEEGKVQLETTSGFVDAEGKKKSRFCGHGKVRMDKICAKKGHSKASAGEATLKASRPVTISGVDGNIGEELNDCVVTEVDAGLLHVEGNMVEKRDEVDAAMEEIGNAGLANGEEDRPTVETPKVSFSGMQSHKAPPSVTLLTNEKTVYDSSPFFNKEAATPLNCLPLHASSAEASAIRSLDGSPEGILISPSTTSSNCEGTELGGESDEIVATLEARKAAEARARWKRIGHTVTFINHMAANIRSASTDLLEDRAVDEILHQQAVRDDAGGVGAAAFEGARTAARTRSKGRRGMEGLLVRQNRGVLTFFQDFYVACLKMPLGHFLIGVFLAPVALGLLFTPLYVFDADGLFFDGLVPEDATTSPLVSAKQRCLAFLNIFLYALSLSTTFGGSPVAARSPFTLLVANVNTLLAQFLFVFLSGAVFARMSQPSYPIRCSKKAIIKTDDLSPVLGLEQSEKFKAFAVRLVLTGPPPCELVDVKICLTFRLFVKLPSGSVFCSTQDLEVVRPEVSYLRYGLMVRHIIDKKSPVYGHTMESLNEGDASFSLTVMGMERTSMQPVFHLEDYFLHDGDVIWEGDYEDFIHINEKGQRVLDHSQIDLLKPVKAAARASQAVSRMKNMAHQRHQAKEGQSIEAEVIKDTKHPRSSSTLRSWLSGIHKRQLLKSKSTSFTRADW